MFWNIKKIINSNLDHTFLFLYIIFCIFVPYTPFILDQIRNEFAFVEGLQLFLLLTCLFLNFKYRALNKKFIKNWILSTKILIIIFIIYEEVSFLTTNSFDFLSSINKQSELNLHNSRILVSTLIKFTPIGQDQIHLELYTPIITIILLFVGFGSYIPYLKKLRFLFLEKKYSIYTLIFPLNLIFSYFLRSLNIIQGNNIRLINETELIELLLYIVLLFDVFKKITLIKINNSNFRNQKLL